MEIKESYGSTGNYRSWSWRIVEGDRVLWQGLSYCYRSEFARARVVAEEKLRELATGETLADRIVRLKKALAL